MVNLRFEISKQVRCGTNSMHSAHEHSYYEMYYLIDGQCDLSISDNIYSLTAGTLIFIPKNTPHQTNYPNNASNIRLYIEFTENYLEDLFAAFGRLYIIDNLFDRLMYIPEQFRTNIGSILDKILIEYNKQDHFSNHCIKLHFQELIIQILRYHVEFLGDSRDSIQVYDESIQRAICYISNNYFRDITLDYIANMLHLNPTYFSKKFKTSTGIGFKQYLNNIRITHSEKLLLETKMSITDIAFKCGYDNSNYYGDAFKKAKGISPSLFRNIKGNVE